MSALITERLGEYLAGLRADKLSAEVRDKAASCFFDAVGLGIAARAEPATVAFGRTIHRFGPGEGLVRLWADEGAAVATEAVAANAFAAHARFQDDCDMASWAHPGSLVVPAAVACAELSGDGIDAVLRGIVAGYSVIHWLGGGGLGLSMVRRGFRTSPTYGGIGAAAAASVVLGLDPRRAAHAVAMAAGIAGGVLDTVRSGSSDFRLQNAAAASQGLVAALAAREGIDGSATMFDSEVGFLNCFAGSGDTGTFPDEPAPESLLAAWAKPFPALGDNMAVIAAALAVRRQGDLDPAAVRAIRVHQNADFAAYPGTGYRGPFTRPTQAIASTVYGVAAMLARGRIRYDDYLGPLEDAVIMGLVGKAEIVPESDFGYLDGVVEVELAEGDRRGSAGDLPSTMFFRDQDTTTRTLIELFDEVGHACEDVPGLVDSVYGGRMDELPVVLNRLCGRASSRPVSNQEEGEQR
ncbi:MmgE/PrpD family protein [Amycolatopsis sp. NPDC051903]|uniref:MmgE/PrpD family protein n=1 Tax=Amycolatopsis sp. NPDC051903 TaxID=3363936 RepID=UPI0037A5D088